MKRFLKTAIASVLAGGLTITGLVMPGCVATPVTPSPTSQPVTTVPNLATEQILIQTGSALAVTIYLGSLKTPTDKESQGAFLNELGTAIDQTVRTNGSSLTDVEALLAQLIAKSTKNNQTEQVAALLVLSSVTALINEQMSTNYTSLNSNDQVTVARELLDSAALGVIESTSAYAANNVPTTQPITLQGLAN